MAHLLVDNIRAVDGYLCCTPNITVLLVCPAVMVLSNVAKREDGWKSFKIERPLDFSLMGMLAETFQSLAHSQIGIFAIATYDTDDILIKEENYQRALDLLEEIGYQVV